MLEAHFARWEWRTRPMVACLIPSPAGAFVYGVENGRTPHRRRPTRAWAAAPRGLELLIYPDEARCAVVIQAIQHYQEELCRICWDGRPCSVWRDTERAVQTVEVGVVVGFPSGFGQEVPHRKIVAACEREIVRPETQDEQRARIMRYLHEARLHDQRVRDEERRRWQNEVHREK